MIKQNKHNSRSRGYIIFSLQGFLRETNRYTLYLFKKVTVDLLEKVMGPAPEGFGHIVWTYSIRRLAVLVGQALKFKEPILLVGDTGYVHPIV